MYVVYSNFTAKMTFVHYLSDVLKEKNMKKFYHLVCKYRKIILIFFLIVATVCGVLRNLVQVNYDMNDYLPADSASTIALNTMNKEFNQAIPNARVMVKAKDKKEAIQMKKKISKIKGVESVSWIDDYLPTTTPLSALPSSLTSTYYKKGYALFRVTIAEDQRTTTVSKIYKVIGKKNCMTGSAVSTALATSSTVSEIKKISIIAVLFLLIVLTLTTTSFAEPFIVLIGLGIAILINTGTNLIFGEISFVTNAAGNILQLAVSLDYSVFLIHRFEEYKKDMEPIEAMENALTSSTGSILSSGLTTVIGFLALILMQFQIGPDLGLALAKGIVISLCTVFLFMPGLILATYKFMEKTEHKPLLPSFKKLGNLVVKTMIPLCVVFVALIAPAYYASNHNSYYYGSSHIFGTETRYGKDTKKIEFVFGKNDTYVLMIPKNEGVKERELINELKQNKNIKSVIALENYVGPNIPTSTIPKTIRSKFSSKNYTRMVLNCSVSYEGNTTFKLVKDIRKMANQYFPNQYALCGEGVSTYDLMDTITQDMIRVNLVAIAAVFVILALTLKSIILPTVLVATIETSVWINMSIPYLTGSPVFYIAYLIISSVQLGATVDYAILFTERYKENRQSLNKKESIKKTVSDCTISILTSGCTMTAIGFLLGIISSHQLLSQLGFFLGKGTLCSMFAVLFVLPGLLYLVDRFAIKKTASN